MADETDDFESFVAVALPRLVRLGNALTGSPHDAWDLAQETLLRVGARWNHLERSASAERYARTTLVRLNISRWRGLRREVLGGAPDRAEAVLTDQVPRVSAPIQDALMTLGPRQRTTVVLRHLYGLSLREIADEMDCSLGTVKSQLHRAEERLRTHLDATHSPTALSTGAAVVQETHHDT
jgi:RNA polymerase sigma-70 factor (sigma-E family)